MPTRKLKPIEERDPYAAAVLNAFDEFAEKFPPAEPPTPEELAAEARCAELAKTIQAEREELELALDAQIGVNAQLCKEFAGLEWLLREHRVLVFWHREERVFIVGEWRFQAPTLGEAIALAVEGFKGKAK